jgi:Protein of unknown function (DUF2971)
MVTVPEVVYHYTDAHALLCVLRDSAIRATDFRHLNDTQEIKYAWKKFISTLKRRKARSTEFSDAYNAQLQAIRNAGAEDLDLLADSVFVACFSESPDDLNQWRNYADDGRGMALGFNREKIQTIKAPYFYHTPAGLKPVTAENTKQPIEWPARLQKVEYGPDAREKAVAMALWHVEKHCGPNDLGTVPQKIANIIPRLPITLSELAMIKSEGFESEREWRLAILEHFGTSSLPMMQAFSKVEGLEWLSRGAPMTLAVRFDKGGPASVKPHTSLAFDKSALVEVRLGPNVPDKKLGEANLKRVLFHHGFLNTQVTVSKLSYRH